MAQQDDLSALRQTLAKLQRKLDDQNARIESLARGREKGMAAVSQLRDELALVAADRDRLRRQLTALEDMQTETMALDEKVLDEVTGSDQTVIPTIDELMAAFSGARGALAASHSTVSVASEAADISGEYQEMISPDLIVLGSVRQNAMSPGRYLVLIEPGNNTKCPLDQDLLTIGRSESADIKVEGDYISRIHSRVLRIGMDSVLEDADSKNGTRVNGELIERHVLKHGDLIRIGTANFRFVDPAAGPLEGE